MHDIIKSFRYLNVETPDGRQTISLVVSQDQGKMRHEERDPKTRKLVSVTIHEVDENDQLVSVGLEVSLINFLSSECFNLLLYYRL